MIQEKKKLSKNLRNSKQLQNFLYCLVVILTCLLILISFLIYVDITKASRKTRIECQVEYLQNKDIIDESFDSVNKYQGTDDWCRTRIENKKGEIEYEVQEKWNELSQHRSYTICMRNRLIPNSDYINKVLLIEVLEFTRISWSFWTFFDRNARYKIYKDQLSFLEADALKYCKGEDQITDNGSGDFEGSGIDDSEYSSEAEMKTLIKRSIYDSNNDLYFDDS